MTTEQLEQRVNDSEPVRQLEQRIRNDRTLRVKGMAGSLLSLAALTLARRIGGIHLLVAGDRDEAFIYPNPTDGRFRVIAQGEDEVSIAVYSTSGALMLSRDYVTADGRVNVDVQGELPAGIYVLKLQGDRLNYSGKLVIR